MTAGRSNRGPVRIRRKGRHTTPTPVEKVAQQAGKAAPAVAIAGALVAAPHALHTGADSAKPAPVTAQSHTTAASSTTTRTTTATLDSVVTRSVTVTAAKPARHAAKAQSTTYRVRSGDTLYKLASRFFHNSDWQYLYHVNAAKISDPNLIYAGESLVIPASAPAHYTARHAKAADPVQTTASTSSKGDGDGDSDDGVASSSHSSGSASTGGTSNRGTVAVQSAPRGHYSCSGLEHLWEQAGGSAGAARMAAEIAMAESGGNPNAISPTSDYGLWQINSSNGSLATLNPQANARSAIVLSHNGTNWSPWTTYRTGAYYGRC